MLSFIYITGGLIALSAIVIIPLYVGEWIARKLGPGNMFYRFWRSNIIDRDPYEN